MIGRRPICMYRRCAARYSLPLPEVSLLQRLASHRAPARWEILNLNPIAAFAPLTDLSRFLNPTNFRHLTSVVYPNVRVYTRYRAILAS